MAAIQNLNQFNRDRQDLAKIKTINDEIILFSKEEAKAALIKYIDEELDLFASEITKTRKLQLEDRINYKLKQIEIGLLNHVNDKIDKITEKIMSATINRKIEEEVNRRLEEKLNKIKKLL